jgi:hypothetical protein
MTARKNARNTRGRPFAPGNPGKPKGARHKATLAAERLLEGQAKGLTQKAITMALAGDTTALRLCLERLVPPRKDRPLNVKAGALGGPQDALKVAASAIEAVSMGDITTSEGEALLAMVEGYLRVWGIVDLEPRLAALEAAQR